MIVREFWKSKKLIELNEVEWELLCDRCGRCCLFKLHDEDTGEVFYTNVACKNMDPISCKCIAYDDRKKLITTCISLTPSLSKDLKWLPDTCAYKLLANGKDLNWWHPLISGRQETVVLAGISVSGITINENEINLDDLENHVVDLYD